MTNRPLTHDEQKAAEAAFRGSPFDPKWSASARLVYDGIRNALPTGESHAPLNPVLSKGTELDRVEGRQGEAELAVPQVADIPVAESEAEPAAESDANPITSREEAVEKGLLVDVSSLAHELGMTMPVGITKPLWDSGISVAGQINGVDVNQRVRDVLIALRLSLGGAREWPSVMQFPALLSFPPETAPRLCSVIAVAHKDAQAPFALTLLHPSEVHQIYPFLN